MMMKQGQTSWVFTLYDQWINRKSGRMSMTHRDSLQINSEGLNLVDKRALIPSFEKKWKDIAW
jgi:hypothetical protein